MEKNLEKQICGLIDKVPLKERSELLELVFKSIKDEINLPESELDTTFRYALREFDIAFPGWRKYDTQLSMCIDILKLLRVFSIQGHSGFSAAYLIPKLTKLLRFEPLTKLTFKDEEFNGNQNTRLSSVFKEPNGKYHYLDSYSIRENYQIAIDNHKVMSVNDVRKNEITFSGPFPLVIMNDGRTIAKVSHVHIKDTQTFDWNKKYIINSVSIHNGDWWESFTSDDFLWKVEQDYEIICEVFDNPKWEDLGRGNKDRALFGELSDVINIVKSYIKKL